MGLPVVKTDLFDTGSMRICRVERYDRLRNKDGELIRIHQEDLCQALGFPSQKKYELEGGPSFNNCFSLIGKTVDNPLSDTEVLIRWHIFNVLAGNADAHAKNLSLLYKSNKSAVLAPFYDLVCTAIYPKLDKRVAMSTGGCFDPGQITNDCWKGLSDKIGVRFLYLRQIVQNMVEIMPEKTEKAIKKYSDLYGEHPVIECIRIAVHERTRRVAYLLRA